MRTRSIPIWFRVNETEADYLNEIVKRSGCNREVLLRAMIEGYQLCEKPDPEFYKVMRDMRNIGNNLNQLAAKAHALGFIDAPKFEEEAKKWDQFQLSIREYFLAPKKVTHKIPTKEK